MQDYYTTQDRNTCDRTVNQSINTLSRISSSTLHNMQMTTKRSVIVIQQPLKTAFKKSKTFKKSIVVGVRIEYITNTSKSEK